MYEWLETHWKLLNTFTTAISFVCMKRQYDGQHHCLGQRTQSGSLASAASPTLDTLEFWIRTHATTVREVSNTRHVSIDEESWTAKCMSAEISGISRFIVSFSFWLFKRAAARSRYRTEPLQAAARHLPAKVEKAARKQDVESSPKWLEKPFNLF